MSGPPRASFWCEIVSVSPRAGAQVGWLWDPGSPGKLYMCDAVYWQLGIPGDFYICVPANGETGTYWPTKVGGRLSEPSLLDGSPLYVS